MSLEQTDTRSPISEASPVTYVSRSNLRVDGSVPRSLPKQRANQAAGVTAPVTTVCHPARDVAVRPSARAWSARDSSLGRASRRRRAQGRLGSAQCASCASSARSAVSVSRDAEGASRRSFVAHREARARAGEQLRYGVRARTVSVGALLGPGGSRASDRRGLESARSRLRDEIHRRAPGARRESHLQAVRTRPRGPLPPARGAHAARGAERARLCAHERASPSREARAPTAAPRTDRSGLDGPLVRRLDSRSPTCVSGRACSSHRAPHMAPADRLAQTRPTRSQ